MPTLYLIKGCPGAGKSNLADILHFQKVVDVVLEADQCFVDPKTGVSEFNPKLLHQAHSTCQEGTQQYLEKGLNVAVSNTSTTEKEVEVYRKIAEECNAKFVSIIVENRRDGKNLHGVPEDKVQQMRDRFSVRL